MKYIIDASGVLIGRCDTDTAPALPGGQMAVDPTPELNAEYAAWAANWPAPSILSPAPYELSKFIILERLIARGLGQAFLQVLASDPLTQARWDAATALDSDNPLFLAAQHQLFPALGATPAEAAQILRPGRDIP